MKKQILFINGHLNTGGVEKSLIDVLQHIDYEKFDVDLLLLEGMGDYAGEVPPQVHVKLRFLQNTYGSVGESLRRCIREKDWFCFRMRLIFLLQKIFGQQMIRMAKNLLTGGTHYDCVIGFRSGICTQIAVWATNADRRITWWHHGAVNVNREEYAEQVSVCDAVAVVSEGCQRMLTDAMPEIASKLVVIPNMLDPSSVQEKAQAFLPYERGHKIQLVSVGRFSAEKHFENIIFSAKQLRSVGKQFCWHLVGDGPMKSSISEAIQAEGLECYVMLEGNQPNPYPFMRHADLFVHPSYVESQGIVVLEAMALGIPCVVTKSLGPCEFIDDGVNGILTEQSPESLTEKVMELLNHPELYQKIKQNTSCPEQFLPERVMEKIETLVDGR